MKGNYFLAKFSKANSTNFTADKNGKLPYVGTGIAGIAGNTIINGSVFEQQGYEPNKVYLCQNVERADEETGEMYTNVEVIQQASTLEIISLSKELGAFQLILPEDAEETTPVAQSEEADVV